MICLFKKIQRISRLSFIIENNLNNSVSIHDPVQLFIHVFLNVTAICQSANKIVRFWTFIISK